MIANNSSGARSVVYGKTIDHVRELHVVLADGRVAHFRPLSAAELGRRLRRGDGIEGAAYRAIPALAQTHAERDRAPLPEAPAPRRRLQPRRVRRSRATGGSLAASSSARRARSAFVIEATVGWCRCRRAKALLTAEFDDLLDALGATPLILRHGPVGRRGDGRLHPRAHARQRRRSTRLRRTIVAARRRRAALHRVLRATSADELPPRLEALERDLRRAAASACRTRALTDAGRAGDACGACARPRSGSRWR